MKPLRLRFRGLHSYRGWQEVDFALLAHSGLFGIFGPTGAGKSTVPDAITLALFGQVERAARGTQGIINLNEDSCEVAFTFGLSGQVYTAQRLFKRVKGDPFASKGQECRLVDESSGQVLADKSTEMTARIEELLGMDMWRFSQTVVLPQGKFDRFLRLKPADRGNMLEDIFHLHEYGDELRLKAKTLADKLDSRLELGNKELALLGECAPAQLAAAEARLRECREQLTQATAAREQAQTAWQAGQALAAKEQQRQEQQQQLKQLQAREAQMAEWERQLASAEKAVALAPQLLLAEAAYKEQRRLEQAEQQAQAQLEAARQRLQEAESAAQAAAQSLRQQLTRQQQEAARAEAECQRLSREEEQGQREWQQADSALTQARQRGAAEQVAAQLQAGEPCPVCGNLVKQLPVAQSVSDVAAVEAQREQAFTCWQQLRQAREQATALLHRSGQKQVELSAALAAAQDNVALTTARVELKQAVNLAEQHAAACAQGAAAWEELKRQTLAAATEQGFAGANEARRALLEEAEASRLRGLTQAYRQEVHTVKSNLAQLAGQLAGFEPARLQLLRQQLEQAEQSWQALLVEEASRGEALAALRQNSRRWQELRGQLTAQSQRRDTARRLQALVSGKAFVRFLAHERLYELVAEASHTIGMLSAQRYRLQLFEAGEGSDFIIVDQFNGGQRRPVGTLSGGEIFLVSLSLALALSRNIVMQGETLGFFFLDEGFGTLDEGMLETVMGILERLPSSQRAVGLISHVPEVKARLPRYLEAMAGGAEQGSQLKMVCN